MHDPPPFNGPFFMTASFSAVSKKCHPPSVSTSPPPMLISDKSLINKKYHNTVLLLRFSFRLFDYFFGSQEESEESDEDDVLTLEQLKKTEGYKLMVKGFDAKLGKPQS